MANIQVRPSLLGAASQAVTVCGIVGVVSDLAQPIAPAALYVLGLSLVGLIVALLVGLFSHKPSQVRLTAIMVFGLLTVVSGALVLMQTQSPETRERGLIATEVGPIGALQAQILNLQSDVRRIGETTDRIEATTNTIDERTEVIDATTRDTNETVKGLKKETSDDPRKELANMGIDWGADPFRISIGEHDARAVRLFVDGGMKLSGARARGWLMPYYLYDDDFSPEIADILLDAKAIESDSLCIDQFGGLDVYRLDSRLSHLDARRKVLRAVCAKPEVRAQVDQLIRTEQDRLDQAAAANANREQAVRTCISDFKAANPLEATLDEAARFSIFSVSTLRPPRDIVLSDLNQWLIMGGSGNPQAAYNSAVQKGCIAASPEQSIDRKKLDYLEFVRDFLKG